MSKVIVTGGSGFLGKRLKAMFPDWIYLSREEVELLFFSDIYRFLESEKPDAVVHLAAKVGGIKDNIENPADFFYENATINSNVIHACYMAGVERVLSALSTCAFPDSVDRYPFTEECLLHGPPAKTNRAYGFTKRALYIQTQAYRDQYGLDYSCFCPSNLYGPGDNFNLETSHFVSAMVRKFYEAKDGDTLTFWGSGKPLRQQLFVDDLCSAILLLLNQHHSDIPLIVAPDMNLSIEEMAHECRTIADKDIEIRFEGNAVLDGQFRKDGSNKKFKELFPSFEFTPFIDGLRQTYDWYATESDNHGN